MVILLAPRVSSRPSTSPEEEPASRSHRVTVSTMLRAACATRARARVRFRPLGLPSAYPPRRARAAPLRSLLARDAAPAVDDMCATSGASNTTSPDRKSHVRQSIVSETFSSETFSSEVKILRFPARCRRRGRAPRRRASPRSPAARLLHRRRVVGEPTRTRAVRAAADAPPLFTVRRARPRTWHPREPGGDHQRAVRHPNTFPEDVRIQAAARRAGPVRVPKNTRSVCTPILNAPATVKGQVPHVGWSSRPRGEG